MYYKEVLAKTSGLEIELQVIASQYGFCPKIISSNIVDNKCIIEMDYINEECLADKYGDDPIDIPTWIWDEIRTMVQTLYEHEGIEYVDITPYNFIEKYNRIYMIDFGDARYKNGDIDWFLDEFIAGENYWNPDYK